MRTALLALLTLSCAASAPPTPPDGDGRSDGGDACGDTADESAEICRMGEVSGLHYRAAVERCQGLQSARIEGACRVALAQAQAASPRRQPAWALLGAELCAPIEGARWRSDCWFILLDDSTLDVDPARWVEACLEHTGSYAGDCVMHGVDRWLIALEGDRPPEERGPRWFGGPDLGAQLDRIDNTWRSAGRAGSDPIDRPSWLRGRDALIDFRGALCQADARACDPARSGRPARPPSPLLARHLDNVAPTWRADAEVRWW